MIKRTATNKDIRQVFTCFHHITLIKESFMGGERYDLYRFIESGTNLILNSRQLWRWTRRARVLYDIINIPCNPFIIDIL